MIRSSSGGGGTASNVVAVSVPPIAVDRVGVEVDCKMGMNQGQ